MLINCQKYNSALHLMNKNNATFKKTKTDCGDFKIKFLSVSTFAALLCSNYKLLF